MILWICATCGDRMFVEDIDIKPKDTTKYVHIYSITCENNHRIELQGPVCRVTDSPPVLQKLLKMLMERHNENNRN